MLCSSMALLIATEDTEEHRKGYSNFLISSEAIK
jgi:hypothetical protein